MAKHIDIDYARNKEIESHEWVFQSEKQLRDILYAEMMENVALREEKEKLLRKLREWEEEEGL